jgi:hypothetical protein
MSVQEGFEAFKVVGLDSDVDCCPALSVALVQIHVPFDKLPQARWRIKSSTSMGRSKSFGEKGLVRLPNIGSGFCRYVSAIMMKHFQQFQIVIKTGPVNNRQSFGFTIGHTFLSKTATVTSTSISAPPDDLLIWARFFFEQLKTESRIVFFNRCQNKPTIIMIGKHSKSTLKEIFKHSPKGLQHYYLLLDEPKRSWK